MKFRIMKDGLNKYWIEYEVKDQNGIIWDFNRRIFDNYDEARKAIDWLKEQLLLRYKAECREQVYIEDNPDIVVGFKVEVK